MMRATIMAATMLGGCVHTPPRALALPQDRFMDRLQALCGKAFAGRLVTSDAADADMAGAAMVMHVRSCSPSEVRVPFHVRRKDGSWDRSRTWIVTRTSTGLRLKHDHRHEDGSEDVRTQYGGDTATPGTATRQEFPVDQYSKDLFVQLNTPLSLTNVWAMDVEPGQRFAYEVRRLNRLA